jgi:hypothetical protein
MKGLPCGPSSRMFGAVFRGLSEEHWLILSCGEP